MREDHDPLCWLNDNALCHLPEHVLSWDEVACTACETPCTCGAIYMARADEREKAAQRVIDTVGAHPIYMTEHDKALVAAARGGEQE